MLASVEKHSSTFSAPVFGKNTTRDSSCNNTFTATTAGIGKIGGSGGGRWVEVYRPDRTEDIQGQEAAVALIMALVEDARRCCGQLRKPYKSAPPSLLLCGPSGTGKSTLARLIARYWCHLGDAAKTATPNTVQPDTPDALMALGLNVMEMNAAEERGVDAVRERVGAFCERIRIPGGAYVVLIEEAETLTLGAQHALEVLIKTHAYPRVFDTYNGRHVYRPARPSKTAKDGGFRKNNKNDSSSSGVCFVLLTNEPHRVSHSLASHLLMVRFPRLPDAIIQARLLAIAKAEMVSLQRRYGSLLRENGSSPSYPLDPTALSHVVARQSYGDLRLGINKLQSVALAATILSKTALVSSSSSSSSSFCCDDEQKGSKRPRVEDSKAPTATNGADSDEKDAALSKKEREEEDEKERREEEDARQACLAVLGSVDPKSIVKIRTELLSTTRRIDETRKLICIETRRARISPLELVTALADTELLEHTKWVGAVHHHHHSSSSSNGDSSLVKSASSSLASLPSSLTVSTGKQQNNSNSRIALLSCLAKTERRLTAHALPDLQLMALAGAYRMFNLSTKA